jgi:tRNA threonylcarbamoyl adenosine modification protein YeaZ/ribosomal-protein-alanine acetyltransferase
MLTLALETVTRRGSIATCDDGRRRDATSDVAAPRPVSDIAPPRSCEGTLGEASRTHGERLPGDVLDWLTARGHTLADVDLFAVISGPGSFTGLRVGIAAIQGFALAASRPVVSVPTLDAMIATWLPSLSAEGAVVVALLDGQRGEVFAAAVEAPGGASLEECPRLLEPMAARPAEIAAVLAERFAGRHLVVVCDDARRWSQVILEAVPAAAVVDLPMSLAESAARIAAAHPERGRPPHALKPLYVRRPDAVLARERGQMSETGAPPYSIRRARTPNDLAAVDALQRQTFTNPWGAEAIRWELENTDVSRLYVMHDAAGALVAYCACWMVFDELHINSLAVDVSRRREGLARRLLVHVLREAIEAGATAATLEVRRSNTAARALYEGLGFSIEGVRRDYYQDPREDAVILWKRGLKGGQRAEGKGQRRG